MIQRRIDTKLIVRASVPEVKPSGYREICLEGDGKLIKQTFTGRRGVCNEDSGFCWVVDTIRCVHKLSHLQQCGPHCALTSGYCRATLAVIK